MANFWFTALALCFQWPADPLRPSQNATNFGGRTLEPLPLALAHGIGSSSLFSRASAPVRVQTRTGSALVQRTATGDRGVAEAAAQRVDRRLRRRPPGNRR